MHCCGCAGEADLQLLVSSFFVWLLDLQGDRKWHVKSAAALQLHA